ncbi:MAG: autotransporter outer membrane beta-barrel domain-containing protein, partial [Elusimicrobiota bacterium]|nr:autotransporter outer membrane beta-barrel domain-containing protein [Elusimicrobiota bacterium]
IFTNNSAENVGGAIYLGTGSSITFTNSEIIFKDNSADDIYFYNKNSSLIFAGDNLLPYAIKSGGNESGLIFKTGAGDLIFADTEPSIMLNTFNLQEGAVKFRANISTFSNLNISGGGVLSLLNEVAESSFYVTGNFKLEGIIEIDVDFSSGTADWIWVGGKFSAGISALSLHYEGGISRQTIKVLTSPNEFTYGDIENLWVEEGISLVIDITDFGWDLLLYSGGIWNELVRIYKKSDFNETILLPKSVASLSEIRPLPFGITPSTALVLHGRGYALDAAGQYHDLGFNLKNSSITFIDISFTNFTNVHSFGGVMSITNSTAQFLSNSNFYNNSIRVEDNLGGGAIGAQSSFIEFKDIKSNFENNFSANAGGAFALYDSKIIFTNSNIAFNNNTAVSSGGVFYLQNSTIVWANANINFKGNLADAVLNDIYFADAQSAVIFAGNNTLENGIRTSGNLEAPIIKTGSGEVTFKGEASTIENIFIVESGALNFKSRVSNISVLTMQNDTRISLENNLPNSKLFISTLTLNADLVLDINFEQSQSDKIYASSITIFTGNNLTIKNINSFEIISNEVPIIIADDFFGFNQNGIVQNNAENIFNYNSSLYTLRFDNDAKILYIKNLVPRDQDAAQTNNQKEIEDIVNGDGHLKYPLAKMNAQQKRFAYDSLSGVFYANIFKSLLYENNEFLFAQISQYPAYRQWANINYSNLEFSNSKQTLGSFKSQDIDLIVGKDLFINRILRIGVFADAEFKNFNQAQNSANLIEINAGVYAGITIDQFDAAFLASQKYGEGKAKRNIELGTTYNPQSDIFVTGFNAALKLKYNLKLLYTKNPQANLFMGPFVSYEFNQINTAQVKEENGGITNLHFAAQTLENSALKSGLEFRRQGAKLTLFANIFAGQNLGYAQKIRAEFIENEQNFKIESDDANLFFYGGQAGANVDLSKGLTIGAQFNITQNNNLKIYNANIGIVYRVTKKLWVERPHPPYLIMFEDDSEELTKESRLEIISFAKQLALSRPKFKKLSLIVRLNASKDPASIEANKLTLERANSVLKLLRKNSIPRNKLTLVTKKLTTRTRLRVRIDWDNEQPAEQEED